MLEITKKNVSLYEYIAFGAFRIFLYLCDDGGQAGLVEAFVVCVGLLVSLPVLELRL